MTDEYKNENGYENAGEREAVQTEEERASNGEKRKTRTPLVCRTGVKLMAFIVMMICAFASALSVVGSVAMWENEMYMLPEESYREEKFQRISENHAATLIELLEKENGEANAVRFLENFNIAKAELCYEDEEGIRKKGLNQGGTIPSEAAYTSVWYRYGESADDWWYSEHIYDSGTKWEHNQIITVTLILDAGLPRVDSYWVADRTISLCYGLLYWVYVIGVAAMIGVIVCFVFLMCASGRWKGSDGVQPGWGTKVPVDLLSAVVIFGVMVSIGAACSFAWNFTASGQTAVLAGVIVALLPAVTGWCMSIVLRIRLGCWWKNSVIWGCLILCGRLMKLFIKMIRTIPLVWKTVVVFAVISLAELLVVAERLVGLWFAGKLILFPVVIWIAFTLRKLQKGGEVLAEGDLSHQVDTKWMCWDFKMHGENLNRIGEGMTAAVEQRLKSERMKAELITNVSHDIKTPLTSIINYADLIGKEPCENEKLTEYAAVLGRQSARLKRLIDDLVEASKAATGNLDVVLAPCEVGVLLAQAAGEYEGRFRERKLEIVMKQPDETITIMADGRRMWRVLDNLMNNVCKYAQEGTRVYLALEKQDKWALISLKNISREPLDLTADEFLERFVQGDASRSCDGNGLGLSIAKSLTELQGGRLELTVDGDLFKIQLCFPVCG